MIGLKEENEKYRRDLERLGLLLVESDSTGIEKEKEMGRLEKKIRSLEKEKESWEKGKDARQKEREAKDMEDKENMQILMNGITNKVIEEKEAIIRRLKIKIEEV